MIEEREIRVLYDASVLGAGFTDQRCRTGIYRAIEQVLRGLAMQNKVEVSLSSYGDPKQLYNVIDWTKSAHGIPLPVEADLDKRSRVELVGKPIDWLEPTHLYPLVRSWLPWLKRMRTSTVVPDRIWTDYDIIHSPFQELPDRPSTKSSAKCILTVYDLIPIKFPQYFGPGMPELLKQIIGSVNIEDGVICCSENTRQDLLEYRKELDPDHVRAIALAADTRFAPCLDATQKSAARKLFAIPPDAHYFLSVCTVEPRKNLRHLVSVFESLKTYLPDNTYLVLVGNRGWQMDALVAEVQRANDQRILMTGYVPDEWLSALYSDALAFVYPSLYEGFGLPPLEAMQCGAPVITANNSSLPEVVGDAGILVDADSPDALSDAMLKVANSSVLREQMSAASLARAKLFSWDRCVRETVQFYHDMLRDG